MANITERLDRMKKTIQEKDFLEGKGLSNEVNIRMFCYDPKDEMTVRHFISQLIAEDLECKIHETDLYKAFLEICSDKRILDRIPALEEKRGKEFLEKQFEKTCDAKTFAKKIKDSFPASCNLLLVTGVGKVFPFMRVHALLNALQEDFTSTPIVVMYPGSFDGHYVKLFNQLKPNEYYRAFNML